MDKRESISDPLTAPGTMFPAVAVVLCIIGAVAVLAVACVR